MKLYTGAMDDNTITDFLGAIVVFTSLVNAAWWMLAL